MLLVMLITIRLCIDGSYLQGIYITIPLVVITNQYTYSAEGRLPGSKTKNRLLCQRRN